MFVCLFIKPDEPGRVKIDMFLSARLGLTRGMRGIDLKGKQAVFTLPSNVYHVNDQKVTAVELVDQVRTTIREACDSDIGIIVIDDKTWATGGTTNRKEPSTVSSLPADNLDGLESGRIA